ncbi:MAG TPA: hypothetical protein VKB80_25835, partial [Kofleriaceae bacterium]|nr:hypothetical protein [Kofleriaceae bacterium]
MIAGKEAVTATAGSAADAAARDLALRPQTEADFYESLLALRLIRSIDALVEATPPGPRRARLCQTAAVVGSLGAPALRRASRQPALDAWVKTADHLLSLGVFSRYPDAHPARHLEELEGLALGWATGAPEGACGRTDLRGRRALALCFGELLLVPRGRPVDQPVTWLRAGGTLLVGLADGTRLLSLDVADPELVEVLAPDWTVRRLIRHGGVLIDVWSEPYTESFAELADADGDGGGGRDEMARRCEEALDALGALRPVHRARLLSTLRCITVSVRDTRWIAGLARLPIAANGPAAADPARHLVERAAADRIERLIALEELPELGGRDTRAHRGAVERAARWCADRIAGSAPAAARAGSADDAWVRGFLSAAPSGVQILTELGESPVPGPTTKPAPPTGAEAAPALESAPPTHARLAALLPVGDSRPLAAALGADPGDLLLRKTRRGVSAIDDWSLLDRLARVDRSTLESVRDELAALESPTESAAFAAAAVSYALGDFAGCQEALRACLARDGDVQEYWHLMAFCRRHLGDMAAFERIVFDGEWTLAAALPPPAPAAAPPPSSSFPTHPSSHPFRGVLRRIVDLRRNERQLSQYVAVMAGVRRSLDDWIDIEAFAAYDALMRQLGLVALPDCLFQVLPGHDIAGIECAPTTRAAGARFRPGHAPPGSRVHVILSSRADWAQETLAAGWYPLAIGDRLVLKPLIDHDRFGRAFGYPSCCVSFFLQHNDWPRQNTLAEALRSSRQVRWQANCLAKSSPWMLIFHMPCAFDCPGTHDYATGTLDAIRDLDADYARRIEEYLRQMVLSINERTAFALRGAELRGPDRVRYDEVVDLRQVARR